MELHNSLSPTSIYFRFFRPVKSLPTEMLARFTQIDYDRDVAFVGLLQDEEGQKILGVARLMADPDVTQAEFAVVIRDDWQGKGVGALLLEKCIRVARERCMQLIWGHVLPENVNMLALGRKLGFSVQRVPGSSNYELRIDLTRA